MNPVLDFLKGLADSQRLMNEPHELAAIWLTSEPLVKINGNRTCRFEAGMTIPAKDGRIVRGEDTPSTHKIIGCWGTCYNPSHFICYNLETNELENIYL